VSLGMSLVINTAGIFERIINVYAGSESRKSTESSSKSSRNGVRRCQFSRFGSSWSSSVWPTC
jgi:hypothetical protein